MPPPGKYMVGEGKVSLQLQLQQVVATQSRLTLLLTCVYGVPFHGRSLPDLFVVVTSTPEQLQAALYH
jgi:hypothetical protein